MLQYKKGRFHCEGVSFEIPENFYYNTMCDMMFDNGMEFISPDSKITIEFSVRKIKRSTKEDLKALIDDIESYEIIDPIMPITVNELEGHQCFYHDSKENYFTVHLKVSNDVQFVYCIRSSEMNVKDALQKPEYDRTLTEIRKD